MMNSIRIGSFFFIPLLLFVSCLIVSSHSLSSRPFSKSQSLQFELLTIEPGASLPSLWGHNLLRVFDPTQNKEIFIDYGKITGIGHSSFIMSYLLGSVVYEIKQRSGEEVRSYYSTLSSKNLLGKSRRKIFVQELVLPKEKKQEFAQKIFSKHHSEGYRYRYDQYSKNCTTQLRDLINQVMDEELRKKFSSLPAPRSKHRDSLDAYISFPWIYLFGITMGASKIGNSLSVYDQAFLPRHLMYMLEDYGKGIRKQNLDRNKSVLIKPTVVLGDKHQSSKTNLNKNWLKFSFFVLVYLVFFCLLPSIFPKTSKNRYMAFFASVGWWSWFLLSGLVGLVLFLIYFVSPSGPFGYNTIGYMPSIHILHPFLLLLPVGWFLLRKKEKTRRIWYLTHVALIANSLLGAFLAILLAPYVLWFAVPACIIEILLLLQIRAGWN